MPPPGSLSRHWDQCKTKQLKVAMTFDPEFHARGLWREKGMAMTISEVFAKLVLVDTEESDVVAKLATISEELKIYYTKTGVFSLQHLWVDIEKVTPYTWWEQYGFNDMPVAAPYIVRLEAMVVNQSSVERMFKAYKNTNSKHRAGAGSLTASQFVSDQDETLTKGIKMATVYAHTNSKQGGWQDPSEVLVIDETNYSISDLDKKEWAALFLPVVPEQLAQEERAVLLKVESFEQPTKQNKEVFFKLQRKYLRLYLIDDAEEDEDGDEDLLNSSSSSSTSMLSSSSLPSVLRKIESITWKTGKGNSYVAVACDIKPGGLMDRETRTEYKIDGNLLELIAAATTAGHNKGIHFITGAATEVEGGQAQRWLTTNQVRLLL
jgi:hypothetical protein